MPPARKARTKEPKASGAESQAEPLPARRKRPWLLALAVVLLASWLGFLIMLAIRD